MLLLASCGGSALAPDGAAGADAAADTSVPTDDSGVATTIRTGLAAAWSFDVAGMEGKDSSGQGLDLDVTGVPTTTGRYGKALAFSGPGSPLALRHISDPSLDLATGDFTVSFWISFKMTGSPQFVTVKGYADGGWFVGWAQTQWAYGLPSPSGGTFADAAGSPSTGTFHHVVFERSGDTAQMLVDGKSVGTVTVHDSGPPAAAPFQIGGYSTGGVATSDKAVNGAVDDVAIWHRALGGDELAYLATHAVPTGP
jgi:Concanavalin A-like lectin/glucanases superfamily